MVEMWRFIEGFEDYQVSNYGNIKSTQTDKLIHQSKSHGYNVIVLDKKITLVHRLVANAFIDNEENKPYVDHKDRDITNNHYTNLRFCTQQENCLNKSIRTDNVSGMAGVYFRKDNKKFVARIDINGKRTHIGQFKTFEEAKAARLKKEKELYGEFSPNN